MQMDIQSGPSRLGGLSVMPKKADMVQLSDSPAPVLEREWEYVDNERVFNEIHLAGTDTREEEGYVVKEILRTGEWPVLPTKGGVVNKPLRIVRNGKSDMDAGVIAMEELVSNFKAGVPGKVQIPLTDDDSDDHKNKLRLNTGFVRDVWIVDDGDQSKLVAKMEFTEPEVKEKVLRGTYADVSCGIPWAVMSRGTKYGSALEHVAITNRPFIDGLGPFLALSDDSDEDTEINHFGATTVEVEKEGEELDVPEAPSDDELKILLQNHLTNQFGPDHLFEIVDVVGETARIRKTDSKKTWMAAVVITSKEEASLVPATEWIIEETGETVEPPTQMSSSPRPLSGLEEARRLRELRLSQRLNAKRDKEDQMPGLTREDLERLELSEDARASLLGVLDENASLRAKTREGEADRRVEELKELGLSDRPGALKLYRQVMLSDDGGPAVVLLSDDGKTEREMTALEILDGFLDAVKGEDGKVNLSDQHLTSGNDNPPPANASDEVKPVEDRVAEAKSSLYGN
jgi:hypothetical protein